jgi:hypothetical protein
MAGINIHSYRERANQAVVLSIIFTAIILIIGIAIVFLNGVNKAFNLATFLYLFKIQPILWILICLVILFPLITYFIFRHFNKQLIKKDGELDSEHQRTYRITDFILKITKLDFNTAYETEGETDKLGKSLIELRDTLKTNQENADKRRQEDEIRSWTAEGLAKFGDILRKDSNDINLLAYNVIKGLTDYINAIQGGFYLINELSGDEKIF